jgi:hypothetical protein
MTAGIAEARRGQQGSEVSRRGAAALRVLVDLLHYIGIVEVAMSSVSAKFDAAAVAGEG